MYLSIKKLCNPIQKKKGDNLKDTKNNTGIPDKLKNNFEKISNMNFNSVRVHYNSSMPSKLNALAYTQGNNVYIGPGQDKHLPHELGHVIQQREGRVRPTIKMGMFDINTDEKLEKEADNLGDKAIQMYGFKASDTKLTNPGCLPVQLRGNQVQTMVVPQINNVQIYAAQTHGMQANTIRANVMGTIGMQLPRQQNAFHLDTGNANGNPNQGFFISFRVNGAGVAQVQHCGHYGNALTAQL